MRRAYSVQTIRQAEAELIAQLPDGALMQRAATGLATVAARILREETGAVYGSRVLLLVGPGDNGGDALYAGSRLRRRGVRVEAALSHPDRAHAGGLAALLAAGGRAMPAAQSAAVVRAAEQADLILDGLLGIGGKGGLRGVPAELARVIQAAGRPVLAVDLPSGIDADSGEVPAPAQAAETPEQAPETSGPTQPTAIAAQVTVTFGAYKPGLLIDPAAHLAGVVALVDIGLGPVLDRLAQDAPAGAAPQVEALQAADAAALLPWPAQETDKYRRGVVGVECGSAKYPGAARLCVGGALHSGAGAVRFSGPDPVAAGVLADHPEVMAGRDRSQSWVVGCGLDRDAAAATRLREVLALETPVLVDADGLALLAEAGPELLAGRPAGLPAVLTPHAGEAAKLLGVHRDEIEARRLDSVRRLADAYGATVLLKGTTTLIAEPGRRTVRANPTGTPALATAGSGDVLAGLIGGLLATGLDPLDAASLGAYLHGLAGRLIERRAGSAGDLLRALPRVRQRLAEA